MVDYRYVAEYDIETKEINYIMDSEQVDAFLKEKGYRGKQISDAWLHCPRYYDDENKISVMYGNFIIGYSKQEGFELLYASKGVKCQYDGRLGYYDLDTRERKDIVRQVGTFTSVAENNMMVLWESKEGYAWIYDFENKKFKKLFKGGYGYPEYKISDDGQYLLWKDFI